MLGTTGRKPLLIAVMAATAAGGVALAAGPGTTGPAVEQAPRANATQAASWTLYRAYDFAYANYDIQDNDLRKAGQVAEYIRQGKSLEVALDGSSTRRVHAVRDALISAGVPPEKIQMGAYGDPNLRTDRRVAVLVRN